MRNRTFSLGEDREVGEPTDFGGRAHADWMVERARILEGERRAERAVERRDRVLLGGGRLFKMTAHEKGR